MENYHKELEKQLLIQQNTENFCYESAENKEERNIYKCQDEEEEFDQNDSEEEEDNDESSIIIIKDDEANFNKPQATFILRTLQ